MELCKDMTSNHWNNGQNNDQTQQRGDREETKRRCWYDQMSEWRYSVSWNSLLVDLSISVFIKHCKYVWGFHTVCSITLHYWETTTCRHVLSEKLVAETFMSTTRLTMDTVQDRDLHLLTLTSVQTCQTVNILGWTLSEESSATAHIHLYLLLNACLQIRHPAKLRAKLYPHR